MKKIYFILLGALLSLAAAAADLAIIDPRLFLTGVNGGNTGFILRFVLQNTSNEMQKVATANFTALNTGVRRANGPAVISLTMGVVNYLADNPDGPKNRILLIPSYDSFLVVNLNPGEGAMITVPVTVANQVISQSNGNFVVEYAPNNLNRFDFWTGWINSGEIGISSLPVQTVP